MEEALEVEPGALRIWLKLLYWWSERRRKGKGGGCWAVSRPPFAPPHSVLFDQAVHISCTAVVCVCAAGGGGVDDTSGLVMLCRHEILMVEEAKQGGGEKAGSNPPSEEGEEAPEKQGAENSPQASQGHWELSYWCSGSCFYHRSCCWCFTHYRVRVHFMGARQVFFMINPPGVTTCNNWGKWEGKRKYNLKLEENVIF